MGTVDLSDYFDLPQHPTKDHVAVVNVLYNYISTHAAAKRVTENDIRDTLVLQMIDKYGQEKTAHYSWPSSCFQL